MALFRKFFYRKPPEGLLEISDRVYVFDCCFTTDVLEEDDYKIFMGGIVAQLRELLPDASFMVFNYREGERQSQIANILSEYDMTVMDYPRNYEGCPLLTMEMIHHCLRSGESWLSLGQNNVLLMHCERGGWPVLAFMLAALLIYRKQYTGEQKTLDMTYKQAPRELLQLLSPLNPLPSQLRYLQYVSRRNVGSQWPPLDRALTLDCVILRMLPQFDGADGCRPIFRIYGQDPFIASDQTPKVLFSTPKKSKAVRFYKQEDCELVKIDIHCHIQGDVVLECINLDDDLEREGMIFRVMFNTAFIRSNILMLNRDEIDTLWNAKDRFPKDFRAEVLLSDMDISSSIITEELVSFEDKEGLPVEAFSKVQEIFSTADWLHAKKDALLQVPQKGASPKSLEENLDRVPLEILKPSALVSDSSPRKHRDTLLSESSDCSNDRLLRSTSKQQLVPLSKMSSGAAIIRHSDLHQDLHAAVEHGSLSKIVSSQVRRRISQSTPASYCNSLQTSPAPISRYHSAPSALGITALLHDHGGYKNAETKRSVEATLPVLHASTIAASEFSEAAALECSLRQLLTPPSTVTPDLKSSAVHPSSSLSLARSPSPPSSLGSYSSSSTAPPIPLPLNQDTSPTAGTLPTKTSTASPFPSPPPPPPPPPLPPLFSHGGPSPSISSSDVFQSASPSASPHSGSSPKKLSSAPPPPPLPSLISPSVPCPPPPPPPLPSSTSSSVPCSPPPPPPLPSSTSSSVPCPPPPPPPFPSSTSSSVPFPPPPPPPFPSSTSSSVPCPPPHPLLKKINGQACPPPPPPPPSTHLPAQPPSLSRAPPPPPPPFSASGNNINPTSQKASSAPPVPPPPQGIPKGVGSTYPPHGSDGNGAAGVKGRGLARNSSPRGSYPPQSTSKRANLKPLHWIKVTRAMQGSLWAETQKHDEASKAPEFDMSELESLFSATVPNSGGQGLGEKSSKCSSRSQKPERVHLVDLRRANNCEIMLTKIKMPLPELMSSALALDDSILDSDQVDNLIKFCPTKEEMDLLKGFNGDRESLGKCEQFFLEMMKVPRVESKLRVFSFKIQFHSQVADLSINLNNVNSAAEEIKNSIKLKRIMQTILSLGNALNQGTARGSAIGFRLDSLLKLTDTRARNNKMTLMHYLCKVLADKLPELLDFPKDLVRLEVVTKIQLKSLAEEMQAINKGLEKVEQELTACENDGPVSYSFRKTLKEFLATAEAEVRSLTSLYIGVGRNADALAQYFGEDPARCPFEQVVSTLLNFVRMFVRAHDENRKQLELERKKALKEAENEKMKVGTPKKGGRTITMVTN